MRSLERKENVWHLKQCLHEAFRKHGIKQLAFELGINEKSLGNQINEYVEHQKLEATTLYEFTAITGDFVIMDEFERLLGRIAVDLHEFQDDKEDGELIDRLAESMLSLGKLGKHISKARHPGSENGEDISRSEFHEISREAHRLVRHVFGLLIQLEREKEGELI